MEVATGEIKAIANLSRTTNGSYIEDFNYVISESTEPGSTMKMASLLAALDDGLINPEDTIEVGNGICYYSGHEMKDAHPPLKTRLSIQEAFETSSNVGVSKAIRSAYAKNPQAFIDKLKSFGLDKKLGLQIAGEGLPTIKNAKDKSWSALSLPWMSIGYESSLTPLQILTFYNAIANNGKIVKPRFVKEVRSHGQLVKEFPAQVNNKPIASKDALAKARKMMEGVVQHGTAKSLKDSPYLIAGKTGTAQIANDKNGYNKNDKSYQASFVGYFPADAPKYSCIVVVYSPSNNVYYGGAVAAPVFKEIADKVYANHLDLHSTNVDTTYTAFIPSVKAGNQRDLKKILAILEIPNSSSDEEAKIVSASPSKERVQIVERKTTGGYVPDVRGMGMAEAIYLLENFGLRVNCSGKGSVLSQSIAPGTKIKKGDRIFIRLEI
jgi:cell division protein FtsI (penicillin-binding protein 3)